MNSSLIAQGTTIGPAFNGIGPLGNANSATFISRFTSTISTIIGILTVLAGLWFIINLFLAAFQWISSRGDKAGLEGAQKRISNSILGLFLVVASYTFIGVIGLIFGLDILNLSNLIFNLSV